MELIFKSRIQLALWMCSCSTLIYMQYIYFHNFSSRNESSHTHTHTLTDYSKYVKNVWASWFHLFTTIWVQQMLLFLTTWLDFNSKSQDCACKLARALRERESTKTAQCERERTRNAGYLLLSALITKLAQALTLSLVCLSLRGTLCVVRELKTDRAGFKFDSLASVGI